MNTLKEKKSCDVALEDFYISYDSKTDLELYKEFNDLKLQKYEKLSEIPGIPTNHQKVIKKILSSYTNFDSLILIHEMGTGKTCSAIMAAESHFSEKYGLDGVIVISRGKTLLNNFKYELLNKCTFKKYSNKKTENLENYKQKYKFYSYEIFAKTVKGYSEEEIIKQFNNKIIIIDEVHNIRQNLTARDLPLDEIGQIFNNPRSQLNIYNEIHKFLHLIKNKKVLLLSGTPMKDGVGELISLVNLLLPLNNQLAPEDIKNEKLLKQVVGPKVSFLKAIESSVSKTINGKIIGKLQFFKVLDLNMEPFQLSVYSKAFNQDLVQKNIYLNSRQSSLFVFPDKTYGSDGYNKNIISKGKRYLFKREIYAKIYNENYNLMLENLGQYSIKYKVLIENLLKSNKLKQNSFVYCDAVKGSGLIVLSILLEMFGFKRNMGTNNKNSKAFSIISNETSSYSDIVLINNIFNSKENMKGDIINIILGSRIISEGVSFKNVIHEHILTPHWNYSETSQVIARGWRMNSHQDLINLGENPSLTINQYVAIGSNKNSIDLMMYEVSEKKDLEISKILKILKTSAIDCNIFKQRNLILGYDNQRECEYGECNYVCDLNQSKKDFGKFKHNYLNIYYVEEKQPILDFLQNYFKTNHEITIDDVSEKLNIDILIVSKIITELVYSDVLFENFLGRKCNLREFNNIIYLKDLEIASSENFSEYYYTRNPKYFSVFYKYENALLDVENDTLPFLIKNVVKNINNGIEENLNVLPKNIQQRLIELAIESSITINLNTFVKYILKYYTASYFIKDKNITGEFKDLNIVKAVVWFHNDFNKKIPYRYFSDTDRIWYNADQNLQNLIKKFNLFSNKQERNISFGYYGLFNKQNNQFCIKDVLENKSPGDKRKIITGKRCENWDKTDLIKIIILNLDIKPPAGFVGSKTKNLLKIKEYKLIFDQTDKSEEKYSQLEYWASKYKSQMCAEIKLFFEQNNLIYDDNMCGVQTKQRK